jgi:hypothetical protein
MPAFQSRRGLRVEMLEDRRMLAVLTVDTHVDELSFGNGSNSLTLREAIALVNSSGVGITLSPHEQGQVTGDALGVNDTIVFSGVTSPIQLNGTLGTLGQLNIQKSVIIDGGGNPEDFVIRAYDATPGSTPIDGPLSNNDGDGGRIFEIVGGSDFIVTIKNMELTGGDVGVSGGGAIRLDGPSLTLENVRVIGNSTSDELEGGGIFADLAEGSTLQITNSIIEENYAPFAEGGGIDVRGNGNLVIANSVIKGNRSFGHGGGISSIDINEFEIRESSISGNIAGYGDNSGFHWDHGNSPSVQDGGGIWLSGVGNTLMEAITVAGNAASGEGGGIFWSSPSAATATIINATISGNRALSGGGILLYGDIDVSHCTIARNVAGPYDDDTAYSSGGGVLVQVKVDKSHPGVPSFSHTLIADNIHNQHEPDPDNDGQDQENVAPDLGLKIAYVTVVGNLFPSAYYGHSSAGVVSPLGNLPEDNPPGMYPFDTISFDYTIVSDITGPFLAQDLIHVTTTSLVGLVEEDEPLLGELQDNGGFLLPDGTHILTHALLNGSPAINAGDPNFTPPPDNDQRGIHFDRVYGGRIDIGAYEKQPIDFGFCDADFDHDGDVDGRDFLTWQRGFGIEDPSHQEGDANFDGEVDEVDLACWQEHYGSGPSPMTAAHRSIESEAPEVGSADRQNQQIQDAWTMLNGLAIPEVLNFSTNLGAVKKGSADQVLLDKPGRIVPLGIPKHFEVGDSSSLALDQSKPGSYYCVDWDTLDFEAVEAVFAELL